MLTYDLFPRQAAVEEPMLGGSFVLWWEMRLGKTRAVLNAFDKLWQPPFPGPQTLVVVCPEIAKAVWRKEAEEMGLELPTTTCYGIKNKSSIGSLAFGWLPQVIVLNWELVEAWLPYLQEALKGRRFVLVLDETHEHATNPKAKRYKAVTDLARLSDRTWILTGTLYKNYALDIYHQLRLLGARANPFQFWSPEKFGLAFCESERNMFAGPPLKDPITGEVEKYKTGLVKRAGGYSFGGLQNESELLNRLGAVLDKRTEASEGIALGRQRFARWVGEEEHPYTGMDAGMERARMKLVGEKVRLTLEYLKSDIPEGAQVVIGGVHREYVEQVAKALDCPFIYGGSAGRTEILAAFNRGEHQYLVGNYESMGVSIDVASAHHSVAGEPDWSEVTMRQWEARTRGPKQKAGGTVYHYLLLSNSVEEWIWNVKLRKGEAIDRLDWTHEQLATRRH
jgi:hypothetical protein